MSKRFYMPRAQDLKCPYVFHKKHICNIECPFCEGLDKLPDASREWDYFIDCSYSGPEWKTGEPQETGEYLVRWKNHSKRFKNFDHGNTLCCYDSEKKEWRNWKGTGLTILAWIKIPEYKGGE